MKEKPLQLRLVSAPGVGVGGAGAGACHSPCHSRRRAPRVRAALRSALPSLSDFATPRKRRTGEGGLSLAQLCVPGNTGAKVWRIPTGPSLSAATPHPQPPTMRSLQGQADTDHRPEPTVRPTKNTPLGVVCSLGLDKVSRCVSITWTHVGASQP